MDYVNEYLLEKLNNKNDYTLLKANSYYLNYRTYVTNNPCYLEGETPEKITKSFRLPNPEVCFARSLGNHEDILVFVDYGDDLLRRQLSHISLVSPDAAEKFTNYLRKVVDFELTKYFDSERNLAVFRFKVSKDMSRIERLFLLTWFRYTYEYPYCLVPLDVLRLSELPSFSKIGYYNIFSIVSATMDLSSCWGTGHGWARGSKFEANSVLNKSLLENRSIEGFVHSARQQFQFESLPKPTIANVLDNQTFIDVRLPKYEKNLGVVMEHLTKKEPDLLNSIIGENTTNIE